MSPSPARSFFPLLVLAVAALRLTAAEYYLDPVAGDNANAGTRAAPWGSLEKVAAGGKTFAAGDVLILLAGHHGSPVLSNQNPGEVVVRADAGARATLRSLVIKTGRFWTVTGLEISPSTSPRAGKVAMVTLGEGSDHNVVRGCLIYTVLDATAWTAADWNARTCNGLSIFGTNQLVESNHIFNVNFGLAVQAGSSNNTVRGNLIEDFSGDGMRGCGDFCTYEGNIVKNLHQVNLNHPDAFQSWSQTKEGVGRGVIRGVVVRGNLFISYENPNQPNHGALQGIGCFDGFYEDWVVENNVIATSAYQGIAFYGARNCRITNNTVVDINLTDKGAPWIMVTKHKRFGPSSDNVVRNNVSPIIAVSPGAGTSDHNVKITSNRKFFVDWEARDLRLAAGSPAIGAGTIEGAPTTDLLGVSRETSGRTATDAGAIKFSPPGASVSSGANPPWQPPLNVPPKPSTAAPVPVPPPAAPGEPAIPPAAAPATVHMP